MVDHSEDKVTSPWDQGHSIEVLREVAAGIVATVQDFSVVPVNADGVPAEWVLADGVTADSPVALYFHGGAYLCGTLEQYRNATVGLSRAANVRVLAIDYRLAPEHPHPAAFEDALTAYAWLLQQPGILDKKVGTKVGTKVGKKGENKIANRVLVAGDSAGASIAVGVAMDAMHSGLAAPCCVVANSPFADLALTSASLEDPALNVHEPNKVTIEWLARTYLNARENWGGLAVAATDPRHSPIYRDLTDLPPLLVQTGGLDNLQDDGKRLTIRAQQFEVTVRHTHYAACGHIWIVLQLPEFDPDVAKAFAEISDFASKYLHY